MNKISPEIAKSNTITWFAYQLVIVQETAAVSMKPPLDRINEISDI